MSRQVCTKTGGGSTAEVDKNLTGMLFLLNYKIFHKKYLKLIYVHYIFKL